MPYRNHPDDDLAHEVLVHHGMNMIHKQWGEYGFNLYRGKNVKATEVGNSLTQAGWNRSGISSDGTHRYTRRHPTKSPAVIELEMHNDGETVMQASHHPIRELSESRIRGFRAFVSEAKASDPHFDLAHEIIMSHGDMEHSHNGSETHEYSSYHAAPEHIQAAMKTLKKNGWKHPDYGGSGIDKFELRHPGSPYKLNHYPISILGQDRSMLTVTGKPRSSDDYA